MSPSILHRAPIRTVALATAWTLGILVMSSIHHVYGAALFATPWRLHIVYISLPVAILILGAIPVGRANPVSPASRIASWLYVALAGLFAVAMIGVYEGGYNHLLPNLQYVLGAEHVLREGLYQPPDDLFFQLTGIAQFVIAAIAGHYLTRLVRGTATAAVRREAGRVPGRTAGP